MFKNKKWIWIIVSGALVAVLGIGVFAAAQVDNVMAAAADIVSDDATEWNHGGRGRGRSAGMGRFEMDEALADYLGMTEEEVEDAFAAAREEFFEQAGEEGFVPAEGSGMFQGRGMPFGMSGENDIMGPFGFGVGEPEFHTYLAAELGITVEELEEALDAVHDQMLAFQVEQGFMTEDQVELMETRQAVMEYVDIEASLEEKLGVSLQDLRDARQEGENPADILDEFNLDAGDIRDAIQETLEEAVAMAVEDGAITQDQADELLENGLFGGLGRGIGAFGMFDGEGLRPGGRNFNRSGGSRMMPGINCPYNN